MSTETQQRPSVYWCHMCSAEVPIYMAPDPTCQRCNEQFIEELHSDDDPREFLNDGENSESPHNLQHFFRPESGTQYFTFSSSTREHSPGEVEDDEIFRFFSPRFSRNSTNTSRSTGNNEEDEDGEEEGEDRGRSTNNNTGERMPPNPQFADLLQNLLSNFGGENLTTRGSAEQPFLYFSGDLDSNGGIRPRTSTRPQRTPASDARSTETNEDDDDDNTQNNDTNDNSNNEPGTMPEGGNRLNSLNSFLQYITALTGGTFDGGMVGNPNDYVFSQGALDNIITQLMEQTSGTAPAPASEQVINSLKQRSLTEEEAVQESDCAVCKDIFEPEERVTELPCEHIFHDDCIKPWLKLNGTCPVCRHSVVPEDKQEDKSTSESDNNSNTNTRPPNPISWLMGNAMGGLAAGRPETLATWPPRASSSSQRNRSSNNNNNRSSGSGNNQNDDSMDIDLD